MIEKIVTNQLSLEPGSTAGQPNNTGALSNNDEDVSVQVKYTHLIEKALQQPHTDTQRVERARDMLLSGELESPLNCRKTAEKILKFGI